MSEPFVVRPRQPADSQMALVPKRATVIPPPPRKVKGCMAYLPWDNSGRHPSTGMPHNTVAICPECGQAYVSRDRPDACGALSKWYPLAWWQIRLKRRLAAALDSIPHWQGHPEPH